jgi:CHC2 zinc finger
MSMMNGAHQAEFKALLGQYTDVSSLTNGNGNVRCPFPGHKNGDRKPSLSINIDKQLFHCFGCGVKGRGLAPFRALAKQHGLHLRPMSITIGNPRRKGGRLSSPSSKLKTFKQTSGLTVAELARTKKLPEALLRSVGVKDASHFTPQGASIDRVSIVYRNRDGNEQAIRHRLALTGPERFRWRRDDRLIFYGLDRHADIKSAGDVLIVEGESDCWTAWHHKIPALGLPGKDTWRSCWLRCPDEICELLRRTTVYVWVEPGALALPRTVATDLPDVRVIRAPKGLKDLSEVHLRFRGQTPRAIAVLKKHAVPIERWIEEADVKAEKDRREAADAKANDLMPQARSVLAAPDPLRLVVRELRRQHYGGNLRIPILVYLALTSRVLALDKVKSMLPAHTLLLGPSAIGKNYAIKIVLQEFPEEAYYKVAAGSPRVFIYDTDNEDLRHKAMVYAEADSLPTSKHEENAAASALRNMLQDGEVSYDVTETDPETRRKMVRHIRKPGPTVLVTTSTKKFPPQMDTRVTTLDVPDDLKQIKASLRAQAATELEGRPEPDPALIAFQGYLQAKAPWSVVVPFVQALQREVTRQPVLNPRINRDFSRIISYIKALAVLRHRHRTTDALGRIRATIGGDYRAAFVLLDPFYEATATGASMEVRQVVKAVTALRMADPDKTVTKTVVARRLRLSNPTAGARIDRALEHGWLINEAREPRYALKPGDSMPSGSGLPTPKALAQAFKDLRAEKGGIGTPPLPASSRKPRKRSRR